MNVSDTRAREKIAEAIEAAIDANWDPAQFVKALPELWDMVLRDKIGQARRYFEKLPCP
jgi:hypothetical protein